MSKNYLVIELLNSFTKQELYDFIEFSSCAYHNTDVYAIVLLKFLKEKVIYLNDFDESGKVLNRQQKSFLLVKMNVLVRLAENFLCYEGLKSEPAKKTALLLEQILQKNQFNLFKRIEQKERKTLSKMLSKDMADYELNFEIEMKKLDYLYKTGTLVKEDNLEQLNEFLDIVYILNKFSVFNTCFSLSDFSQKTYSFDIFEDLKTLLNKPKYIKIPLLDAYLISSQLLQTQDELYYFQLIDLLKNDAEKIPKSGLKAIYFIANNFCSKKIKMGDEQYYYQMFELYHIMDKNNLIIEDNFVQVGLLKNVVTIGCKVEEYTWALNMVEKYKNSIQKKYRLSIYHFNVGAIAYYKKNYDKALNHFIKVDKVDLAYDIDCRIMILKCHYELDDEYDERAMRRFVLTERYIQANKELVKNDKKAYKNFIRILLNTYRVKHKATRMTIESLLNKIEKVEFISDKKWLLEKIKTLDNPLNNS